MRLSRPVYIACLLIMVYGGGLFGCSETRYAAHVVKQIPIGEEVHAKNKGYYKVGRPYVIKGRRYYPKERYNFQQTGVASWYGPNFHGKLTANGEIFDKYELTAAHKTLQMPSIIRVTNLGNGRSIILRVNDRGPFAHDRVLDVSERAAELLGFKNAGTARVKIDVIPEASRVVANAAKQGRDTRGYEVALNQNKTHYLDRPSPAVRPPQVPQIKTVKLDSVEGMANVQPATGRPQPVMNNPASVQAVPLPSARPAANPIIGTAHAAPIPKRPPTTAGKIFVQAASFSQEANAHAFSQQISSYGPSKVYMTRVNNAPFFRVRLGPYSNQAEAEQVAVALRNSGKAKQAVLVKDQ